MGVAFYDDAEKGGSRFGAGGAGVHQVGARAQ
jgi:hypothetical protein